MLILQLFVLIHLSLHQLSKRRFPGFPSSLPPGTCSAPRQGQVVQRSPCNLRLQCSTQAFRMDFKTNKGFKSDLCAIVFHA